MSCKGMNVMSEDTLIWSQGPQEAPWRAVSDLGWTEGRGSVCEARQLGWPRKVKAGPKGQRGYTVHFNSGR